MEERPEMPDERPQRRREYSGAGSTLGAAAVIILAVGVAIWYFEFAGGSTSSSTEAGYGIVALPDELNPTGEPAVAQEGRAAPNFTLATVEGEERSLVDFRGDYVLVNFWATWCPPCRAETPRLQNFYEDHRDQGIVIVGVNQQETPERAGGFAEDFGVTYPMLLDRTGEVSDGYRVSTQMPVSYLVDPDGVVVDVHLGEVLPGDLEELLERHVRS